MFVTKLWQYHAYLNSTASIDENGFVSNFPMSIIVYSILNGCDGETLHLIISSRDFHFNFVLICLIVGYWTIKPARWHFSFNYLLRSNCVFFTLIRINSFEIYIPPFAMESDRYVNIYYAIGGTELLACIYCDVLFCIPVWWTLHFILINVINKHFLNCTLNLMSCWCWFLFMCEFSCSQSGRWVRCSILLCFIFNIFSFFHRFIIITKLSVSN